MTLLRCIFFPITDNREHLIHFVYKFSVLVVKNMRQITYIKP